MFPPDTFLRDYQAVAQVLNHKYYPVVSTSIYSSLPSAFMFMNTLPEDIDSDADITDQ